MTTKRERRDSTAWAHDPAQGSQSQVGGERLEPLRQRIGWLMAEEEATDVVAVRLLVPPGAVLCAGMNASAEARSQMPWRERYEELRQLALQEGEETLPQPGDELEATLWTVFRRRPEDGAICMSANQVRSLLQAAARALYTREEGQRTLANALREHMAVWPTRIPILRDGKPIKEPDGVLELPRPIKRPPFERSVIQQPEYVRGPVTLEFLLELARVGKGQVLTEEVLRQLLRYGGRYIGLGSHRGLDDTVAGKPGVFQVVQWEWHHLRDITPPTLRPVRRRRRAAAASDGEASNESENEAEG